MSSKLRVFEYKNCDTCRRALRFLEQRGVAFERHSIVERPPSPKELRDMLEHLGGDLRKLFNTSGQAYRELNLSERLPLLTADEALALLASNGKLIKRPFLLGAKVGLIGFKPEQWESHFP